MISRHRLALVAILVGNAIVFAGVDPPTRLATAVVVALLMIDLKAAPAPPRLLRAAAIVFAALVAVQLIPLPAGARQLLQPGFADVMPDGWAPMSLAPWASLSAAAAAVVALGIAVTAARVAVTRSGLPVLLVVLASTGVVIAVLGLAGEAGAPDKVLLIRDNTGGGSPYGPFVNENHFAQAVELTLPAALVLLAVNFRKLRRPGSGRQLAAVMVLGSAVAAVVTMAALLRSGSRGGALFIAVALLLTVPLWFRPRRYRSRRWPGVVIGVGLSILVAVLSWTRLPELEQGFRDLVVVEGVDGNTRWDLWRGTVDSWWRSPLVGSGLGSYRYVIGMDRPATGESVLEQAHNDWLEWMSTTGLVGGAALVLCVAGLAAVLAPGRVRRLRFEYRYAVAGVAVAFAATALHEIVGFGLQTPLNRYLLAAWVGLLWGVDRRIRDLGGGDTPDETRSGGGE